MKHLTKEEYQFEDEDRWIDAFKQGAMSLSVLTLNLSRYYSGYALKKYLEIAKVEKAT